jgi:hypothetical protein
MADMTNKDYDEFRELVGEWFGRRDINLRDALITLSQYSGQLIAATSRDQSALDRCIQATNEATDMCARTFFEWQQASLKASGMTYDEAVACSEFDAIGRNRNG